MGEVGADLRGWLVRLSVAADDGGAMLDAAPELVDGGASLVDSPESDLKELVVYSREQDRDRARDSVVGTYQRLRRVAGLDPQPAQVVSLERPLRRGTTDRPDVRLMNEARRILNSEPYYEWAVVLAQTACEVYAQDILERTAATLGPEAIEAVEQLPSTNLAGEDVRRVFHELTGYTPPDDAGWWRDYQAHAQRRHRIVHAGDRVTRQEAEASLAAAKAMIGFLAWPSQRIDADARDAAAAAR